jgi:hypothetical protein
LAAHGGVDVDVIAWYRENEWTATALTPQQAKRCADDALTDMGCKL